ncbi:MAG: GNAT family N-acetyltransferase [Saprospiraceae bacterium]|nr:GNAT family N-acetyltransferase [Saprospiraceae bacterium]
MLNLNFNPFPELQTEKISLRKIRSEDAIALYRLRTNADVMKYLDRPIMQSVLEAEQLIQMMLDGIAENKNINWCICTPTYEQLLGTIAFWKIDETNHRAEIGYILDPDWQGKGLMSDAMRLVIDYGFSNMRLHGIDANVNPANQKSINLLTKFGFQKEAHFRENYFFNGHYFDSAIYCLLNGLKRP